MRLTFVGLTFTFYFKWPFSMSWVAYTRLFLFFDRLFIIEESKIPNYQICLSEDFMLAKIYNSDTGYTA